MAEEKIMNVYKIGNNIAEQYHGCGHALAAITNGEVVAIRYLSDIIPEYDENDGEDAMKNAIADSCLAPAVREMQALGEMSIGMLSSWEFVEM
jgi:hypothetical protein